MYSFDSFPPKLETSRISSLLLLSSDSTVNPFLYSFHFSSDSCITAVSAYAIVENNPAVTVALNKTANNLLTTLLVFIHLYPPVNWNNLSESQASKYKAFRFLFY